jgi:hypothetical protein
LIIDVYNQYFIFYPSSAVCQSSKRTPSVFLAEDCFRQVPGDCQTKSDLMSN